MGELTITITIADRQYRLTIDHEEEEIVRKSARRIEDMIKQYANNYAFKDKQDLLAMVALQNTTSLIRSELSSESDQEEIEKKLKNIDLVLSDSLSLD